MSDNTIKYTIELVDQFGQPMKKLNELTDKADKKVKGLNSSLARQKGVHDNLNRSIAQLKDNIERYRKAAENSFRTDHVRKYKTLIEEAGKRLKELEDSTKSCSDKTQGLFSKLKENFGISKGVIGWAAVAKGVKEAFDIGKEASEAARQVEVYEVSLKNMLGSSSAAKDRMQEYYSIAAKTPFDLQQVVEGGNKLQALGKYSKENLIMLGDLAAASGKPMEQALSAYAKMASGQKGIAVDMFRDLMITTDDWVKATGKGLDKSGSLKATTSEMLEALPKIMEAKGYLGMMASQANTTQGKIANLEDGIFQLKAALGDRLNPTVSSFAVNAGNAVDKVRRWVEIPLEQKIAAEKIELNTLVGVLTDATTGEDERARAIDELNSKYPNFLQNIDLEKDSADQLREKLAAVNEEYDKKMRNAALSRKMDALEESMGEAMDDAIGYEVAIGAEKTYNKNKARLDAVLKGKGLNNSTNIRYSFDRNGRLIREMVAQGSTFSTDVTDRYLDSNLQKWIPGVVAEMYTAQGMMNPWGNDEKKRQKALDKYNEFKTKRDLVKGMIEDIPTDGGGTDPGGGGGSGSGGGSGTTVESDAATISGGGSKVKNFYINIGNLLGENTNIFQSSDDNPETADAFMDKLSTALQMVVNDVNYVS